MHLSLQSNTFQQGSVWILESTRKKKIYEENERRMTKLLENASFFAFLHVEPSDIQKIDQHFDFIARLLGWFVLYS